MQVGLRISEQPKQNAVTSSDFGNTSSLFIRDAKQDSDISNSSEESIASMDTVQIQRYMDDIMIAQGNKGTTSRLSTFWSTIKSNFSSKATSPRHQQRQHTKQPSHIFNYPNFNISSENVRGILKKSNFIEESSGHTDDTSDGLLQTEGRYGKFKVDSFPEPIEKSAFLRRQEIDRLTDLSFPKPTFPKVSRPTTIQWAAIEEECSTTYGRNEYQRGGVEYIAKRLTPEVALQIKLELNEVKEAMQIHPSSQKFTQFYKIRSSRAV